MKVQLSKFCHYWDEAALETLGSEFRMTDLMQAQPITRLDCTSILDDFTFDVPPIVEVPTEVVNEAKHFAAPWD